LIETAAGVTATGGGDGGEEEEEEKGKLHSLETPASTQVNEEMRGVVSLALPVFNLPTAVIFPPSTSSKSNSAPEATSPVIPLSPRTKVWRRTSPRG